MVKLANKEFYPFFIYKFIKGINFITTITFFVFFLEKNIDYKHASILLSILSFLPIFFEVITGIIADTFSRKFSVLIGVFLEIIVLAGIIMSSNFFVLLFLFVLWGISSTFISGADEAWAINNMSDVDKEKQIDRYYSISSSFFSLGMIFAGIISVLLLKYFNQNSVWIFRAIMTIFMFIILFFIKEKRFTTSENNEYWKMFLNNIFEAIKCFKKNKIVKYLIMGEVFMVIGLFIAGNSAMQDYLLFSGIKPAKWGIIYTIVSLLSIFMPFVAIKISKKFKNIKSYLITVLLVHGTFFVITGIIITPLFAVLLLFFHNIAEDFFNPVNSAFFQKNIPEQIRATMVSLQSMLLAIGYTLGLLIGGILTTYISGQYTIAISAIFFLPAIWFYYKVPNK